MHLQVALAILLASAPHTQHSHDTNPPVHDYKEQVSEGQAFDSSLCGRMPQLLTSFGACSSKNQVYVLGGYFGKPHKYGREHQSNLLMRLDLANGEAWEILPNDMDAVQSVVLVENQGNLFRVGGMRALNSVGDKQELISSEEFAVYDSSTGSWRQLTPLPTGRSSHAAAVVEGKLYVVGGWEIEGPMGRMSEFHSQTWVHDLSEDGQWEAIDTPFYRRALAAASIGKHLIAIGGMNDEADVSSRVDSFDTQTQQWSQAPNFPEQGFGVAACTFEARVYASGSSGELWSWKPGEQAWRHHGQLAFPRFFHHLLPTHSGLVTLGGISKGGRIAHLELLNPTEHLASDDRPTITTSERTRPSLMSHVRLAFPGSARNRWAGALKDQELFLFGGNNSTGQHDFEREHFLSQSWKVNLASLKVKPLPELPVQRQSMRTAEDSEGNLLVFAGFGWDDENLRSHSEIYTYWTQREQWQRQADMPVALTQFGLVSRSDHMAIYGGLNYVEGRVDSEDFVHSDQVHKLDFAEIQRSSNTAKSLLEAGYEQHGDRRLGQPRRAHGCAELNGQVYVVGGMREGFAFIEECEVHDTTNGKWSSMPAPSVPRINPTLLALGSRLFLIGGSSDRGNGLLPDRSIEVFDTRSQLWSKLEVELPINPRHAQAFVSGERLLIASTFVDPNSLDLIWIEPR